MLNTTEHLPIVRHPDMKLCQAAEVFVAAKARLDEISRMYGGKLITSQVARCGHSHPSSPFGFAYEYLPFFRTHRQSSDDNAPPRYKALVPSALVIGDSWRWRPATRTQQDMDDVVRITFEAFTKSDTNSPHTECAQYTFIKPLGIFLASEGKNRVALFNHLGLEHIPAIVTETGYPSADRIRLFLLKDVCLAVLDDRYVQRVTAPYLVKELLEAYGVSIEHKWPHEYPSLWRVLNEFERLRYRPHYIGEQADLHDVADEEQAEETLVPACLMALEDLQLPEWKTYAKLATVSVVATVLASYTDRWPDLQKLLVCSVGVVYGWFLIPFLPVFRVKVKRLKEQQRWSGRGAILRMLKERREHLKTEMQGETST